MSLGRGRKARGDNARVDLFWRGYMTSLPIYDGVTATCRRFGFSRTYFTKNIRPHVEVKTLAKKLLVRQIGPGSVLEHVESLPSDGKAEQHENLARGTALSHKRRLKKERLKKVQPVRERAK